jgi:hypothetical protein
MSKHERDKQPEKSNMDQPKKQQKGRDQEKPKNQQLTKEDLPDSTNESQGTTGSGQRQDSN